MRKKTPFLPCFLSVAESVSSFSLLLLQMFHNKGKLANSSSNEVVCVMFYLNMFFLIT